MARESSNSLHTSARPTLPTVPAEGLLDIAPEDWSDLLSAVKTRLRMAVGAQAATSGDPLRGSLARIQAHVLECVSALDQLHTAMLHESGRCDRLEREVGELRGELDDARTELLAAQA